MLKIYGYAASINVRKVLWMCEELALPFEREDWAGGFRSTAEPRFRALNPVGMVPVIDDAGIIDEQLGRTGAYIAGNAFTIADIVIGLSLHRWRSIPMSRPLYRHVDFYYERLLERGGFRRYGRDGGP